MTIVEAFGWGSIFLGMVVGVFALGVVLYSIINR